ncbi:MAG: polysaccharide deacetylase family protein [Anaerolineae bacterium]|nr:polysaccharide deacetylase family protein [Anaerolineae bacterium]
MQTESSTGTFLFSLDTELVWGYFDLDDERERLFSPDGSRERRSIRQILDLMDEFGIRATWAVVGGMMYDRWEPSASRPVEKWQGQHRAFDQLYETDNPVWYGADVIGWLLEKGDRHEIGCHGFTHTPFPALTEDEARIELESWIQAAARYGIKPKTIVFPRNQVAHLELLKEVGFTCYRGKKVMAPIYTGVPVIGKVYNRLDLFFQFAVPQVYEPSLDELGMANLPSSQWLFRINRKLETTLDTMNLHRLRLGPMIKGIRRAAEQKKVIHLWAHPWEFRTEKDIDKLRVLFGVVQDEVKNGRLRSVTMGEMADELLEQ